MAHIQTLIIIILTAFIQLKQCQGFLDQTGPEALETDMGKPLFLTPYIEKVHIEEAKRLARVKFTENNFNITSYSGFFTVNKEYDSNQFFWYFPPIEENCDKNPVVVWLEGGPGASDMFSLFYINGPLAYQNGRIEYREYNWARQNHIIYIDNPVGTGFSFTNDSRGYCTDQTQVGEQLYSTLSQFFAMFPELQSNPLIISGESYGGKYVPALAYTIHKNNPKAAIKMNLTFLHIGNPLIDPEHQIGLYNQYLYNLGLLDRSQAQQVKKYEDRWLDAIKNEHWIKASVYQFNFFDSDAGMFREFTGYQDYYNFLHPKPYISSNPNFTAVIFNSSIRKDIHVGNLQFHPEIVHVLPYLQADMMKSVAPWVVELLDHYYLSIYTGQLDIAIGYPLVENFLMNLKHKGSNYAEGIRSKWTVDGELKGYIKQAGRISHTLIQSAGHFVPMDQPKWAWELLLEVNKKIANKLSIFENNY